MKLTPRDVDTVVAVLCNADFRADLCERANRCARESRRGGAPLLTVTSAPTVVARWLQWCDPNGCHADALAQNEGHDPYDDETAWEALYAMLSEGDVS